jgi:hypothetical protein
MIAGIVLSLGALAAGFVLVITHGIDWVAWPVALTIAVAVGVLGWLGDRAYRAGIEKPAAVGRA